MTKQDEQRRVPKLRFKGFSEDWEQEELENIAEIVGGGTPSTKESSYWNGNINWFTPNEIGRTKYVNQSMRKITALGLNKSSAQILPANKTILFTSRATIGTVGILTKDASTNQGFQSFIVNENNDIDFLYYKLITMKKEFLRRSVGSTFLEISGKTLKNIKVNSPTYNEQIKIGKVLSKLDDTISLHKRKISNLILLKNTIINSFFDNIDNTINLNNIAVDFSYGINASAKDYDGNNRYLRITDIDEETRKVRDDDKTSPDCDLKELENYTLHEKDIVFARTGSVGRTYLYNKNDGNLIYAGYLIKVSITERWLAEYLFNYTLSNSYKRYVHMVSQRSIQPGLNINDLKSIEIPFIDREKSIEFNKKVKALNKLIDNCIKSHDNILELKYFYLNNLFI